MSINASLNNTLKSHKHVAWFGAHFLVQKEKNETVTSATGTVKLFRAAGRRFTLLITGVGQKEEGIGRQEKTCKSTHSTARRVREEKKGSKCRERGLRWNTRKSPEHPLETLRFCSRAKSSMEALGQMNAYPRERLHNAE